MKLANFLHHPVALVLMVLTGAGLIAAGEWLIRPARAALAQEERKKTDQLSLLQTRQKEVTPTDWNDLQARWRKIFPATVPDNRALMEQLGAIETMMKREGWLGKLSPAEAEVLVDDLPDLHRHRVDFEINLPPRVALRKAEGSQQAFLNFLRQLEQVGGRRPMVSRLEVKLGEQGEWQASGTLVYFRLQPDVELAQ